MKPGLLLAEESRWCKFALAKDCDGTHCGIFAPGSVKWCLSAAMALYTGLPVAQQVTRLKATSVWAQWSEENRKSEFPIEATVEGFNDTVNHAVLLEALREANL